MQYGKNGGYNLYFFYDDNDQPLGFYYTDSTTTGNGIKYYFVLNAQGDVVQLRNLANEAVANYRYDAWGKLLSITDPDGNAITNKNSIAYQNPIRYRGYVYDDETGFYYLNTRYYDPSLRRFINADGQISGTDGEISGYNQFSYCFNNPVNMDDSNGNWPKLLKKAVKWATKNIAKPIAKSVKKRISQGAGVKSRGFNISASPSAFSFNIQGGVSIAPSGDVALQGSYSGGITTGTPSFSATYYQTETNAPEIDNLAGPGYQVGGSVSTPITYGCDLNIIPDKKNEKFKYWGTTAYAGFGVPGGEIHVEWGETKTLEMSQFNIFEVAEEIYIKIMEW